MRKKFALMGGLPALVMFCFFSTTLLYAEEGVTPTEVHIGIYGPLSGPAKLWATAVQGSILACQIVNEQGGVHGRKIVPHVVDDSYNPAKTKSGVKRLHQTVGIFAWAGGVGTDNGRAVKNYFISNNIPWVGPLSGSKAWFFPPKRNIFALYPAYRFEAAELCQYAVEKMGKKRIAMVYQNDGYGAEGLIGANQGLQKYRLALVEAIAVGKSESNLDSVIRDLRLAKPEVVLIWLNPFSSLRLIKVARSAGFSPQWMSATSLAAFKTFYPVSRGLIQGMITANSTTYDADLLKRYKTQQERLAPEHKWDNTYLGGIHVANILIDGIRECGRDLTREGVIAALEQMHQKKTLGGELSFKPFAPDDPLCRLGHRRIYLQKCMPGGQRKFLTNWLDIDEHLLTGLMQ